MADWVAEPEVVIPGAGETDVRPEVVDCVPFVVAVGKGRTTVFVTVTVVSISPVTNVVVKTVVVVVEVMVFREKTVAVTVTVMVTVVTARFSSCRLAGESRDDPVSEGRMGAAVMEGFGPLSSVEGAAGSSETGC